MLVTTTQHHYAPENQYEMPEGIIINPGTVQAFGSLRLGTHLSILVNDPAALRAIAFEADNLAAKLELEARLQTDPS